MELCHHGHDMHSLERTAAGATGLPHLRGCTHGPGVHQVSARVDDVGRLGRHLHLG